MSNAIVYSMYIESYDIEKSLQWQELKYSLDTLRKYNKQINVKIYIAPYGISKTISRNINLENCEIIDFDVDPNPLLPNQTYAKWLDHKWKTAFKTLQDYDRVLMIDCDTFYTDDPVKLFNKYNDTSRIYSKADLWEKVLKFFDITEQVMNDGVVLLSKEHLKYKEKFLEARDNYVLNLIKKTKNKIDHNSEIWNLGLLWTAAQFGISNYLLNIGNPIVVFDQIDVGFPDEYQKLGNNIGIVHYTSYEVHNFLPKKYWYSDESINHHMVKFGIGRLGEVNKYE